MNDEPKFGDFGFATEDAFDVAIEKSVVAIKRSGKADILGGLKDGSYIVVGAGTRRKIKAA